MSLPSTPTFVLPYKRYAFQPLLELSQRYLENDGQSYRQTVRQQRMVIGYQTPATASAIDERALDHTTIWRMLGWLGAQVVTLRIGRKLLAGRDPNSDCHRFVGSVAPHKFRSPERERLLRIARQLLDLANRWDRQFSEPFFPRFATRAGFS